MKAKPTKHPGEVVLEGLKHVWLGSVAEHIVRRPPCPVLVVREREHEFVES